MPIKVLIVDDQVMARRGLRMRLGLEPDLTIVGEAGDGAQAIALTRALQPDVVIMDVFMPGMDGITATHAMRDEGLPSAVVMVSMYDDGTTRAQARDAGAAAFVGKDQVEKELIPAIHLAAGGVSGT